MAKNVIHESPSPAARIYATNGTGGSKAAGKLMPLATGNVMVLCLETIANGASGACLMDGVISYTKESGTAWTQGQAIYYDAGNDRCTHTSTSNKLAGIAYEAAASAATTGKVIIGRHLGASG